MLYCLKYASLRELQKSFKIDSPIPEAITRIKNRNKLLSIEDIKKALSKDVAEKLEMTINALERDSENVNQQALIANNNAIENKGNLSINNNGTLTQTQVININTKPEPRSLNTDDESKFRSLIPSRYTVEVWCSFPDSDKECSTYGIEIEQKLKAMGYKVISNRYLQMDAKYDPRFTIDIDHPKEIAKIVVSPLKL